MRLNERRLRNEPNAKSASNGLRNDLTANDAQRRHPGFMITLIKNALSASGEANIEIAGWIRSRRDAKTFSFLEVNDGSWLRNLQVIIDQERIGCIGLRSRPRGLAQRSSRDLTKGKRN